MNNEQLLTARRLLPAAYAKRRFRTRRHGANAASGTLARSACEPTGGCFRYASAERMCLHGKWQPRMPNAVFEPDGTEQMLLWVCRRGAHINRLAG
jgi:hypothetical protein